MTAGVFRELSEILALSAYLDQGLVSCWGRWHLMGEGADVGPLGGEGESVVDGIAWFLEPHLIDCVTFARGVEPAELASRLGARPGQQPRRASADDAVDLLAGDGVESVARVGWAGGWSFAVEYGDAVGPTAAGMEAASAKGVEAVSFLLTPWHPPSMFTYHRDGKRICSFGIGEEADRRGDDPDMLVPALTEVGVLPAQRDLCEADAERARRLSVLTIGEHFRLRLPRADVLEGQLPLYVVREV